MKKFIIYISLGIMSYYTLINPFLSLVGIIPIIPLLINPYYLIPFFISLIINFNVKSLICFIIPILILFIKKNKKNTTIIGILAIFISSMFYFNNIFYLIANLLIGTSFFISIMYILNFNVKPSINNYGLFQGIMLINILIGAYNTNSFLPLLLLGIMILSKYNNPYYSFILSTLSLFIINIYYIPLISIIYFFDFHLILLIPLLIITYYFKLYDLTLSIIISSMIFELIRYLLKYFPYYKMKDDELLIDNNLVNNFNNHILEYATFIDDFKNRFLISFESKKRFNEAFNNMLNNYCLNCKNKFECHNKYRLETYYFIKSCLIYGLDIYTSKVKVELKDFINKCMHSKDLINHAHSLKNKYNLKGVKTTQEKVLSTGLGGISNTIRQYSADLTSKNKMPSDLFKRLYQDIKLSGFDITIFEIKNPNYDDLLIEIGISNSSSDEINIKINKIADKALHVNTCLKFKKMIDGLIVFIITNKPKYKITYGYSSLAKNNLNIAGDNYLIKPLDNRHFIAAISDGMGSGYKAFNESKLTLEMIDRMSSFDVSIDSTINIINTFISLKENLDQYATLDLIEINECNGLSKLYKLGGSNTYIYKDSSLKTIYNSNLPIGISDLTYEENIKLDYNDIIILASDGINDSKLDIKDIILKNINNPPQIIAYNIIDETSKNFKSPDDDMSIIVLKIEKYA